ncbi:binding-protein-dependent transport systems inner membrane component [Thermobaculum terrenum ATCC BAA-798]|uniref:Binding-protein-dependent transport systems inner membrane component n=1 Tax=Thermobaculum terrenum (strain ATCC BAA-798 / CCMEE 7001 / YNP1) TaxID=525904 RepID=D1CEG5_THET1|nr:carbohydrate ABC transporter permease [Thermobaculum terrenum]ACZ41321.1 binding-protein-dependent transport systems inner membrane component [Thermobaculum terrenum ATCC BAA-798]
MSRSRSWKVITKLLFYLLVAVIIVYTVFPFYWALRSAITPTGELFSTPVSYWPSRPTLEHFRAIFSNDLFLRAILNSTIVAGSVTIISLAIGSLAAYALGRFKFRGRTPVMYIILSMTVFPQIAVLSALFQLVNFLHLFDTLGALILTYLIFTLPFTVWVLITFFRSMPQELEQAAYVDGATPFQTFRLVLLPLAAPGIVTSGLLAFIAAWNEFLYALSFIQTPQKRTITFALQAFTPENAATSNFAVPWGQIMAATLVVTLPLIVLTLIFQRRIIAGLTAGSIKG